MQSCSGGRYLDWGTPLYLLDISSQPPFWEKKRLHEQQRPRPVRFCEDTLDHTGEKGDYRECLKMSILYNIYTYVHTYIIPLMTFV